MQKILLGSLSSRRTIFYGIWHPFRFVNRTRDKTRGVACQTALRSPLLKKKYINFRGFTLTEHIKGNTPHAVFRFRFIQNDLLE